jgi:hypothetical protein
MCCSGPSSAQHVQLLLREVADRQALALGDVPPSGGSAGDGLDQRRLALAVGAQDADALAGQHLRLMLRTMVIGGWPAVAG